MLLSALRPHFFFFNDTATTEIYTLSLHDALPIFNTPKPGTEWSGIVGVDYLSIMAWQHSGLGKHSLIHVSRIRSEEHTSELQSRLHLVCRLLLEKKKRSIVYGEFYFRDARVIAIG